MNQKEAEFKKRKMSQAEVEFKENIHYKLMNIIVDYFLDNRSEFTEQEVRYLLINGLKNLK